MTKLNILSRRIFLGTSALALASVASTLDQAVATSLSKAANLPPQKVRFDAGDSFVVGNLYVPADYSESTRYPAVVVAGSLTSVKEQMGGTYAAEMAQRGFVALAIDYRHYGESGGEPRQYEDPEAKAVDLSAAVSFLSARQDILANSISLLGVCTSGGTVLYTAASDNRVAAVACVASH